jgi:hypothetical protein
LIKVQRYSSMAVSVAISVTGLAVLWLGVMQKPHHYWLQDCGSLIILMQFGASLLPLRAQARILMPTIQRFRRVCDLYSVPFGFGNAVYQWLCPFMFTTWLLALTFLATAMILRTSHPVFRYVSSTFQILCVLGNVIFQTRLVSIQHKLDSIGPSKVATSPPTTAKFILLLIPKRHREHLIGDLEEEYMTILLPEYGETKARTWYWWQVAISVGPLLWAQIRRGTAMAWLWKFFR